MAIDYDKIASRMDIEIISVQLAHASMLLDVMQRAAAYYDSARRIEITVREPERDGSIEYIMHVQYISGGSITIGALRRTADAETEFHS
jgi:hypothetical protein